ncbi:MAG TPA: GNAT family N-acetyltransferase [Lachnospiraceae bacterium]|nr:GNAT family N-acetyltransferase [Lachnospiraceae bacterium]
MVRVMSQEYVIVGEKICLRRMTVEDTQQIIQWRNSEEVMEQFLFREPLTVKMHLSWIENKVKTGLVEQFIVCVKETGREIGSTYLRDIDRKEKTAEYGMFIGETEEKGKGYGREMEDLTTRYALDSLGMEKVMIRMLESNIASYKAAIANGYRVIPEKEETMVLDGHPQKVIFMEVTK